MFESDLGLHYDCRRVSGERVILISTIAHVSRHDRSSRLLRGGGGSPVLPGIIALTTLVAHVNLIFTVYISAFIIVRTAASSLFHLRAFLIV